ncbi:sigma factor-like helix-turn-helix DNA-binding protein [Streptomyces sp. NPDC006551]|uniref:sigma factor-like helix-turn-helix DNA-binding protein n=1 Tax=Streptomyces sp. NPDC006551 TaxID=3157178 RepID=UPI0033BB24D3
MDHAFPAERYEERRPRLRAVAYHLLGSLDEADEAVREAWSRLGRSAPKGAGGPDAADDLDAGLTTAVARVCLTVLRAREARRENPWDPWASGEPGRPHRPEEVTDPEQRALLADTGGPALLSVLDTLPPAERLAYVLHDVFALPIEEIAPVVEHTPAVTRQLAARARRRVRGTEEMPEPDLPRQREVVVAFLAAARAGDVDALLRLLDPDVVLRADAEAVRTGVAAGHGARAVARTFAGLSGTARDALVDGAAGLVRAPVGKPETVFAFTVIEGRVTAIDALADPPHLARLDVRLPAGPADG